MKKQKRKFVLVEASLDEINKQLKINTLVIIILVVMLMLNATQFMRDYSLLYGALIAIMLFLLFVMAKSRTLLTMQKQTLIR
jgi:tetrahydromethanopterin S-methyltransferase subunit G